MKTTTIEFEELRKHIQSRFAKVTGVEVEEIVRVIVCDGFLEVKWKQKEVI